MKKLQSTLLLMLCALGMQAQSFTFDEDGSETAVVQTKATAKQIYRYSRYFFAMLCRDYAQNVIQVDDPDNNAIQIRYVRGVSGTDRMGNEVSGDEFAPIRIEGKEGKFRITVDMPTFDYTSIASRSSIAGGANLGKQEEISFQLFSGWVNTANFIKERQEEYDQMASALKNYIEYYVSIENF